MKAVKRIGPGSLVLLKRNLIWCSSAACDCCQWYLAKRSRADSLINAIVSRIEVKICGAGLLFSCTRYRFDKVWRVTTKLCWTTSVRHRKKRNRFVCENWLSNVKETPLSIAARTSSDSSIFSPLASCVILWADATGFASNKIALNRVIAYHFVFCATNARVDNAHSESHPDSVSVCLTGKLTGWVFIVFAIRNSKNRPCHGRPAMFGRQN